MNPETSKLEWLIRKDGCMHCADPGCLKACPSPGAIVQYSNGIVDFIHDNCIGCGYCVKGCPFDIPRVSKKDHKAYKCTLCSDRVAVGQGPACAKACPTQAIAFGTKEDMKKHADGPDRRSEVARLRECRPLRSARASAARMSCMCCTTPTSRTSIADLPDDPKISPIVRLWKGATKTVGLVAMGFAAAVAVAARPFRPAPTASAPKTRRSAEKLVKGEAGRPRMSETDT